MYIVISINELINRLFHRRLIFSMLVSLVDEIGGFLDLAVEVVEVRHVSLDLVDWQLDEHTGDLWSSLVSNHRSDEWEDGLSNFLLEVWVSLGD